MEPVSSSLEDYLEAIWNLGHESRAVRVKDIGKELGVRSPSVVGALKTLAEKGLVSHERYGYVELTGQGEKLAREVYRKHTTLAEFFTEVLGVDIETAAQDACAAEHSLSGDTLDGIRLLTEFLRGGPSGGTPRLRRFRSYAERHLKPGKAS
jgi:DtxR family Mn-dependent transcriptional regulator